MSVQPQLRILEREGCPLHYWLAGPETAPLVVLTHGAGIDHQEWEPQLPDLLKDYRVLMWDVRGHGQSRPMGGPFTFRQAVDDLLAILDNLGIEQTTFVGHSMGGNLHQELVFYHPERVHALVMLGCTCNTQKLTSLDQLTLKWGLAALPYWPFLRTQSAWISSTTKQGRDALFRAMRQTTVREFAEIMKATATCLHYEPGYRIEKPMLVAVGEKDVTGNIREIAKGWAERDQAEYVVIPQAGHAANLDDPVFFNRALLDFLHRRMQ